MSSKGIEEGSSIPFLLKILWLLRIYLKRYQKETMFLESILFPDIPNRGYYGLFLVLIIYGSSITLIRSLLLFLGHDKESLPSLMDSLSILLLGVFGLVYLTFTHNIPGWLCLVISIMLAYCARTLLLAAGLYHLKRSKHTPHVPVSCVATMSVFPQGAGVAVMHDAKGVAKEVPVLNISDRTINPGETLFFKNDRNSLVHVSYKKEDVQ